jgi:hypothetical protein
MALSISIAVLLGVYLFLSGYYDPPGSQWSDDYRSWALGISIGGESILENGLRLSMGSSSNITVIFTLPGILKTDNTLYCILSVMTGDGVVLQVAMGLDASRNNWVVYAMIVEGIEEKTNYILLDKEDEVYAEPYDRILLSIYSIKMEGYFIWMYKAINFDKGLMESGQLYTSEVGTFMDGLHEVFAFESYTTNNSVLENLWGLRLIEVLVDGDRVIDGFTVSDGFDFTGEHLFVVGGTRKVPSSVFIRMNQEGYVEWGYRPSEW